MQKLKEDLTTSINKVASDGETARTQLTSNVQNTLDASTAKIDKASDDLKDQAAQNAVAAKK